MAEEKSDAEAKLLPREPARERGRVRYDSLLEAATIVLRDSEDVRGISLEQIAKVAGVTSGSAYHFFPSIEALYVALMRKYREHLLGSAEAMEVPPGTTDWQEVLRYAFGWGRELFNGDVTALRLFYSDDIPRVVRTIDRDLNRGLARIIESGLRGYFLIPDIPLLTWRIGTAIDLQDAVWAKSYNSIGTIDEFHFEEGLRAAISYLRTTLPGQLALAPPADEVRPPTESS